MERIDDMFYYPCPCGDRFQISLVRCAKVVSMRWGVCQTTLSLSLVFFFECLTDGFVPYWQEELQNGEEVAHCPSCTLVIRVIYDPEDFDPDVDDGVDLSIAV